MNYPIQIYRGAKREYFGSMPFLEVVRASLQDLYGWDLTGTSLKLSIIAVPEDSRIRGLPSVVNLIPEYGYAYVKVFAGQRVIYRHPHPLEDLVTLRLQRQLRERVPEEAEWAFRIDVPGMPERSAARATPEVEGVATVRPFEAGEGPRFLVRRIEEEPLPPIRMSDLGVNSGPGHPDAKIRVVLTKDLHQDLLRTRPLSPELEEGGFLLGQAYRDEEREGAHVLRLTAALNAEFTGASLLHFTFTGDSFAAVKRSLRETRAGERLVGWYHTHLFPASDTMGLSSIDDTLHFSTFTIPWQVAGLINLDTLDGSERTLRFYYRDGNGMKLCPFWVAESNP